jgi:hypothetical protein
MPSPPDILLHHSEAVDHTLIQWLLDKIDDILGFSPTAMVLLLGSLIVLFPAALLGFMWYQRRKAAKRASS